MDLESINISFDDIFGGNPENISMTKLEDFLEQVVTDTFQYYEHKPHELVRVVEDGCIRWMTAEDAESYLESTEEKDEALRRNVQQALRGDRRIIEQEIKLIFVMANNTLQHYRDNHLIQAGEIKRIEPNLIRLGRQVNFELEHLKEIDERIQDIRNKNPILDEFEHKMGELLNLQKNGKHEQAALIANELASMKHRYVRLSRGLESDQGEGNQVRLDLQRHKKSILSSHRYLVAQREGILQEETQDLREKVDNLKMLMKRGEEDKKTTYANDLDNKSEELGTKEKELTVVKHEQAVLKKKEDEAASIVEQLENAFAPKKPEEAQASHPSTQPSEEPHVDQEEDKKFKHRMAAVERRQR